MYLYGASGHGKVIKEILEAQNRKLDGFIDDNMLLSSFASLPVVHEVGDLNPIIISIGNNAIRKRIAEKLMCQFATGIHPSAVVSPSVEIGEGSVIMPGAIINADVKIGKHCIVNTGASIDHECIIEDYCHVAPHATLCGQVIVGEGTLIGVGSSVIPCVKIGQWCVVGAGAAVIDDIVDNTTVVGVPAKKVGRTF